MTGQEPYQAINHAKVVQHIRLRYIIGLSTIAILVTISFFTMQHVVSKQRDFSKLLNLAGHQAGLCNRIAYFASIMATTDEDAEFASAKAQVGRGINRMSTVHEMLHHGDPDAEIPHIITSRLSAIYDSPALGLDMAVHRFLDKARALYNTDMSELHPGAAAYLYVTTYGPHVLEPLLDAAVTEYEDVGRQSILKIELFERVIWITTLLTLLLELLFIFRPLARQVKKALLSLETSVEELDRTRTRLMSAQKMAQIGDWEMDPQTGMLSFSNQACEIFDIADTDAAISQKTLLSKVHPEDKNACKDMFETIADRSEAESRTLTMEVRTLGPGGTERLVYQQAMVVVDHMGQVEKISGTVQDITERRTLSIRLEKLSAHIPGFIFQFHQDSDGHNSFPFASMGVIDTFGIHPDDIKNDGRLVFNQIHEEDRRRVKGNLNRSGKQKKIWQDQYRIHHPEKGLIWLEGHATPELLSDGSTQWYGYIWDITERRQAENQIRRLALYDSLTGLANRRLLKDRIAHAIATSHRNRNYGAVIMLDLDNFKVLNDTKGHNVGDALLIEVAQRLRKCVRQTDTIARLGGDEFVVVLEWLTGNRAEAYEKAMRIAQKIRVSLREQYLLCEQSHIHHASASVGVALFMAEENNVSELLKRADVAMYEAKELGRNRVCFYSEVRQAMIDRNSRLAHDLQLALKQQEFALYLQPQISRSGRLCSAEALIRWFPRDKDPVSPGAFIPVAENTGLILPMGEWVLKKACSFLKRLSSFDLPDDFSIAVNISARQFNDEHFVEKIRALVAQEKVNTRQLKFELTETSLVMDLDRGQRILSALREMGIRVELDDFGTGYSSLNALNNLPLHTLKIDRSLVSGVETDLSSSAIVRAVIAMAKAMSLNTIAEGVETDFQKTFLISEGCDILQGFLFAKPMPFNEFVRFLKQHSNAAATADLPVAPFPSPLRPPVRKAADLRRETNDPDSAMMDKAVLVAEK